LDDDETSSAVIIPFIFAWLVISEQFSAELSFKVTEIDEPKRCFHCSPAMPSKKNKHKIISEQIYLI